MRVTEQSINAAGCNRVRDKSHDAEWRETNHPLHDFCHGFGKVAQNFVEFVARVSEGKTHNHAPSKNSDIICRRQRVNRIVDDVHDDVLQNFNDAARRSDCRIRADLQFQCRGEQERRRDRNERRQKSSDNVKLNYRLHCRVWFGALAHCVHDQNENQNRRDALQCVDEKFSENRNERHDRRHEQRQRNADNQTHGN